MLALAALPGLSVVLLLLQGISVNASPAPDEITTIGTTRYACKCYRGDRCWPSSNSWAILNYTVNGNLRAVVPDPAVCYNTFNGRRTYNAEACAEVTRKWTDQNWQSDRQVSAHWILWTNTTCLPTENPDDSCTLGNLPEYVIMAKRAEHIKAGVDFARRNNLRLIIRNTGHDFLGRSTGFGSLAINTHALKDVRFVDRYRGPGSWTGGAVTVGAGIQGRELLTLAHEQNPPRVFVGGECPSVGFAGGYIQGGGHGPLASLYGMAADQALSFDVVTADGRYVTANSAVNSDLFWALKGGGPSTFAAVVSVTVKTFVDAPAAGASLYVNFTHTVDQELIWKGFRAFHNLANHYIDNNMFAYYEAFPFIFRVRPFVAPQSNATRLAEILKPLYDQLQAEGVPYDSEIKEYSSYYDLYIDLFEDEVSGANTLVGGRLFTRRDIAEHGDEIAAAKRSIVQNGMIGHIVGPGVNLPVSDTAINPVWRNGSSFTITLYEQPFGTSWEEKMAGEKYLTDIVDGPLRAASPYGAAYVNEGNLAEPNWQTAYWGDNYPRLLELKQKWDPLGVFYARTTPGTENWEMLDEGKKLCKRV
ncbi:FAD binding domain-containing protein [Coprinopsis marcescibilis]|uniref:FAD binding domain-containing protein n=1 Tax=Coprinopsis marcescibilis TaxID=230819 RepID=A0A5C3L3K5_COPMA|nr:FAD binding domain-containing protein [Coprinopsis marcescibilis]